MSGESVALLKEKIRGLQAETATQHTEKMQLLEVQAALQNDLAAVRAQVQALTEENERLKAWKDALIDSAVVNWTYTKEHETNPRACLNAIIAQVIAEAMDPQVSKAAHDLVERAEAAEASLTTLATVVREYGQHKAECIVNMKVSGGLVAKLDIPQCTCGFKAALAEATR